MGPDLPSPIHHANAAVVDGAIYIVGALETANFTSAGYVWSWNPATETAWTMHPLMPAGSERGSSVVGVIGGRIYIAGGLRNGAVPDFSSYDPATEMWDTTLPPLPDIRDHGCGAAIAGKLYVAGGRRGTRPSFTDTVFEYTPSGAWVSRAPMPTARGGIGCGVVDGDRLVVVGGEGNPDAPTGVFPQVEAYRASTDTWDVLTPMPNPRHGMGCAGVGASLYVPGGGDHEGFGVVSTHDILTP
jgi:N-acetylneuraminic acid mutarotase